LYEQLLGELPKKFIEEKLTAMDAIGAPRRRNEAASVGGLLTAAWLKEHR